LGSQSSRGATVFYSSSFPFYQLSLFFYPLRVLRTGDILKVEFKLVENFKRGGNEAGITQGSQLSQRRRRKEGVMVMKEELTNKGINIVVPFLVGGVVGAGVALLFAPKTGKEIRNDMKRFATTTKDRVTLAIDKGKELYEEGRTVVESAIDAGKNAYIQEKEKWQHA